MFKMDCQKNTTHNIRHEKRAIKKIKPIKTGKKLEQRILQGVKITPIILNHKITNKVLREKSNWVVCWSSKSRFSKQIHNNKK